MPGATLVARSMRTTSSNDAARTRPSPNVSTAHLTTLLAGAVSNSLVTASSSSALGPCSVTVDSVTECFLLPYAEERVAPGRPPGDGFLRGGGRLDGRLNPDQSIHD